MEKAELFHNRRLIKQMLEKRDPADAMVTYYAMHHSPAQTELYVMEGARMSPNGFISICRTGLDLFRPLVTLRAKRQWYAQSLISKHISPGTPAFVQVPVDFKPAIDATFTYTEGEVVRIFMVDSSRFRPTVNVLVTRAPTPSGNPRFVIRGQSFDRGARPRGPALATAGMNWRSPVFADIYVNVEPEAQGRKWGQSVVSSTVGWLLENGIIPLYSVAEDNRESMRLATDLGFYDTGARTFFCSAVRNEAIYLDE
ncbi:MAG: hypothetical protein ABFQ89_03635 [Chloroflexota bacterium]